jgi:hypothetical protein
MEGIEIRAQMRARVDLTNPNRGFDDRLGGDAPQIPRLWGQRGPLGGGRSYVSPLARRAADPASDEVRDVVAERELVTAAMKRAHHRRARRRPLLTWFA